MIGLALTVGIPLFGGIILALIGNKRIGANLNVFFSFATFVASIWLAS